MLLNLFLIQDDEDEVLKELDDLVAQNEKLAELPEVPDDELPGFIFNLKFSFKLLSKVISCKDLSLIELSLCLVTAIF